MVRPGHSEDGACKRVRSLQVCFTSHQGQVILGGLCTVTLSAQPVSLGGPGMPLGCTSFEHPVIVENHWDLWP